MLTQELQAEIDFQKLQAAKLSEIAAATEQKNNKETELSDLLYLFPHQGWIAARAILGFFWICLTFHSPFEGRQGFENDPEPYGFVLS